MPFFTKKPVTIEAVQWTGDNVQEVTALSDAVIVNLPDVTDQPGMRKPDLNIATLEGVMHACIGDWIIKGVRGECYPCKPDIFEATYDLAS